MDPPIGRKPAGCKSCCSLLFGSDSNKRCSRERCRSDAEALCEHWSQLTSLCVDVIIKF